jgi:TnpA family transposase
LRLVDKLERIQATGILSVDLSWLNNNYQRSLTRYARRCSAARLRNLQANHRYAVLVCFLWQTYQDAVDYIVDTYDKIITGVYKRAQTEMDEETKRRRRMIRTSLMSFRSLGRVVLDEDVSDSDLRQVLFSRVDKEDLATQVATVDVWLQGKYSHVFKLVMQRFTYLRQFAPALLASLEFRTPDDQSSNLVHGIQLLRDLNEANKRKLPDDAPLGFIPKALRPFVEADEGTVNKRAWECALLAAIRDDIRAGNIFVQKSKRFGRFDNFFISDATWHTMRAGFFERAGLPATATDVPGYLTKRLNLAYDNFLESLPQNTYAQVDEDGWHLSTDPGEKLDADSKKQLDELHNWLSDNLRQIKLPELLIEVDNELQFTHTFMTPTQQDTRMADQVCAILATIMAHGCNIGPFTMSRLTEGVPYTQIKQITDWQLTEEAQKQALAQLVKATSRLDVTQAWGEGKTSSSDAQRFRLRSKVLQRTYSHRINDYALEFYYFVADNYAPFYSTAIECKDRDAAYVLDGLLYNESDLALEEHYTDTHGYTEINFAAFAMLGRRFSPRIRGIQKQRIYRIDKEKDYGALAPLVKPRDRIIHLDWVTDQWDRMGHFYASLESGHATASTALKRLVGYSGKNHFYRANRELGRVFKTEHILRVMSDPLARQQMRRGLLKSEEMNALARQVAYGKQGTLTTRELEEQKNTSSCLTLIMACVIYWQAKEINRVILECDPEGAGIDLSLLEHISPIGWDNVLLYGEYVLNRSLVKEQNVIP